jgi:hypothetical protein
MTTCANGHRSTGLMVCTYPNGSTSPSSIESLVVVNAQGLSGSVGSPMLFSGWLIGFVGWCLWFCDGFRFFDQELFSLGRNFIDRHRSQSLIDIK